MASALDFAQAGEEKELNFITGPAEISRVEGPFQLFLAIFIGKGGETYARVRAGRDGKVHAPILQG